MSTLHNILCTNHIGIYPEINADSVANIHNDNPELYQTLRTHYTELIGCCNFICKPRTAFTTEWFETVAKVLDNKYELLVQYPGRHPREGFQDGYDSSHHYPIQWTEILGNIFHPLIYKYRDHVIQTCPQFITTAGYR